MDRKITPDPMFPVHLGPKYRLRIDEGDENWLGLPPGEYKLIFKPKVDNVLHCNLFNEFVLTAVRINENE
jgi:hypothetical protein